MNLKNLSDKELMTETLKVVALEREILVSVLHHLQEVDRRRLYAAMGYESLYDFAMKHLSYSKDQAYRRISAMRLLREIPQVEQKIGTGELSLTHIGMAQTLFQQEKRLHHKEFSTDEKAEVLEKLAKTSTREARQVTLTYSSSPVLLAPDQIRCVTPEHSEFRFTGTERLEQKVRQIKGLLAHQKPDISLSELFEMLCDLGLETWDPGKIATPRKRKARQAREESSSVYGDSKVKTERASGFTENDLIDDESSMETQPDGKTRGDKSDDANPPSQAEIRRQVFRRAQSKCENCGSQYALEVDHIQPRALGGDSTLQNLRLLCRSCNQHAGMKVFGVDKMDRHLHSEIS